VTVGDVVEIDLDPLVWAVALDLPDDLAQHRDERNLGPISTPMPPPSRPRAKSSTSSIRLLMRATLLPSRPSTVRPRSDRFSLPKNLAPASMEASGLRRS
jgi:hypothetical protein